MPNWSSLKNFGKVNFTRRMGMSGVFTLNLSAPTIPEGSQTWRDVAMSTDGVKRTAVADIGVYTSTDSGVTWALSSSTRGACVKMSSNGVIQTVGEYSSPTGRLYVSTDSGVTWTPRGPLGGGVDVAMSVDGVRQTVVQSSGNVLISSDSGLNWTQSTSAPSVLGWASVAMSSDGKVQTIGQAYTGRLYTSSNYGVTWTQKTSVPTGNWQAVAMSYDGSTQTATVTDTSNSSTSGIYTSSDSGSSWTQTSMDMAYDIAVSRYGYTQVAVSFRGTVFMSTDWGVTWRTIVPPFSGYDWTSIEMSDNGLVTATGKSLYTSTYFYASRPLVTSSNSVTATAGTNFSYQITAINSPTSYGATTLPAGLTINTDTGVISGVPSSAGSPTTTISATNAGGTGTKVLTITVAAAVLIPAISSAVTRTATVGTAFSYTITATNSPTSYSASGLPAGLNLNTSTGVISGTPTTAGSANITINASNSAGTGTTSLALTTSYAAPVITSSLITVYRSLNTPFSYQISATNSPTSYSASGLPTGMSVNSSTGVISGTPSAEGTYTVTITATNPAGTGSANLSMPVIPPVIAPVIVSSTSAIGIARNSYYSYTIIASNYPSSYSASGLPPGLGVSTSTGLIAGTPSAVGTYTMTIGATNSAGTGSANISITVGNATVIISATSLSAAVNTPFSYQISATNSPTSYSASGLPAGLSVNSSTGVISGTPTATGGTTATMGATNAVSTHTTNLYFVVYAVPSITSSLTSTATAGTPFSYQISATNSPTSYMTYDLPAGLNVNTSTGLISGVITDHALAGTSTFQIIATNPAGTDFDNVTLTILGKPVINSALTFTTFAQQAGSATSYTYQITAINSPTSYNATGLPAGFSINTSTGVISGAWIGVPQSFYVTISATNAIGTGSESLQIIAEPNMAVGYPVVSNDILAMPLGTTLNYNVIATNSPSFYAVTAYYDNTKIIVNLNASTGLLTVTSPVGSSSPTTAQLNIAARNARGWSKQAEIVVSVRGNSSPSAAEPVVTSATSIQTDNVAFSYQITGSGSTIANISMAGNYTTPHGLLALNGQTGVLSGGNAGVGSFTAKIKIGYYSPVAAKVGKADLTINSVDNFANNLTGVTAIAAGYEHALALKSDGSVVAWGENADGESTVPVSAQSGVIAIAAGYKISLALKSNGSVVAWGSNYYGQRTLPASVAADIVAIAAGQYHCLAISRIGLNKSIIFWGNPFTSGLSTVPYYPGMTAVSAGIDHSVVLSNGEVKGWGSLRSIYLANFANYVPSGGDNQGITAISSGDDYSLALKSTGAVIGFGVSDINGSNILRFPASTQSGVTAIAAGYAHALALKSDGSVVVWGGANTAVPTSAQSGVTAIAAGYDYSLALKSNGTVVAWKTF